MPPREDYQTNSVDGAAAFERGRAIAEGFNDEEDYETYDEGFEEDEEPECRCGDGACPECGWAGGPPP